MIFFSGQLPINVETGVMPEGIEAQTTESLKNIQGLLESQGLTFADVVKTTVYMKDLSMFSDMNEVYAMFFEKPYPARSCVEVARLPKDVLCEVEVIACLY